MSDSFDLTKLNAHTFEHMVNMLALRVLGYGHTGFGPGADGGRDGYFEGDAPYPSENARWNGIWYIQTKFHAPHLTKDPQKWLIEQVQNEIKEFSNPESKRRWPDNWIIATNIDPSGTPETGAFDRTREIVTKARPQLRNRFHIWGGQRIISFLMYNPDVTDYYRHFLTPGHLIAQLQEELKDNRAETKTILRYFILTQFSEQQYTRLEQAGSAADSRPGIHHLFIDLPFRSNEHGFEGMVMQNLIRTASRCHRVDEEYPESRDWQIWSRHPSRARVWFVKGGPGQGKSTIGQYYCQVQRAALIALKVIPRIPRQEQVLSRDIQAVTEKKGFWPEIPRIPISIELKEYAQWYGQREKSSTRGVLTYLAETISAGVEQQVLVGTLKRLLTNFSWVVVFDGLDEVPDDVKDEIALEVRYFIDNVAIEINCDLVTICTSRPQGYSGQFNKLDAPTIELTKLEPAQALQCAKPVLEHGRGLAEARRFFETLQLAIVSESVQELMTTPLQAHIMAVVIRDGGRPPERRWQLFNNFYQVIKKRESNRNLPDKRLAKLLREDELLLKTVHNRLGFLLHARAETSKGAQTTLSREEFKELVSLAVSQMMEKDIDLTIETLMKATIDRLVLVSTPDDGNHVRFDIRPLQEFFAAEFIYDSVESDHLRERLEIIAGDSHWREVTHFIMSALIENNRRTEIAVAISVLEHIDQGYDDAFERQFRRRFAKGALISLRLLQEGVLEQDKRIRQQFRTSLSSLFSSAETSILHSLGQVQQGQSRIWLINFALDVLQETKSADSVGAAVALFLLLRDDDEQKSTFLQLIWADEDYFLSSVLTASSTRTSPVRHRANRVVRNWHLEIALNILFGPRWKNLSAAAINTCLDILRSSRQFTFAHSQTTTLSKYGQKLLRFLIEPDRSKSRFRDIDYGFVRISIYENNDFINNIPSDLSGEAREDTDKLPELLQMAHFLLVFLKHRSRNTLVDLLTCISKLGRKAWDGMPYEFRSLVPIRTDQDIAEQLAYFSSLSERDFATVIANPLVEFRPVRSRTLSSFPEVNSPKFLEKWSQLVEDYPRTALQLWGSHPMQSPYLDIQSSQDASKILMHKLIRKPEILLSAVPLWGSLFSSANQEANTLRQALLQVVSDSSVAVWQTGHVFQPFMLRLPLEAPLLPHIISGITQYYDPHYNPVDLELDRRLVRVRETVSRIVEKYSNLKQIAADTSLAPSIQGSALLLCLLHPSKDIELSEVFNTIIEVFAKCQHYWYIEAILLVTDLISSEEDPAARQLVARLFEKAKNSYHRRQAISRLLSSWREKSNAPVQLHGVQDKWLGKI